MTRQLIQSRFAMLTFLVLVLSLVVAGCAPMRKAPAVEYQRLTQENFPPTSNVITLWGRDATNTNRRYKELGTTTAVWSGPSHSTLMWLGKTGSTTLNSAPASPLPEVYRSKAIEMGANALLIPTVNEGVTSTKMVMPTVPNKYNLTNDMYLVITIYTAKVTAIRFEE